MRRALAFVGLSLVLACSADDEGRLVDTSGSSSSDDVGEDEGETGSGSSTGEGGDGDGDPSETGEDDTSESGEGPKFDLGSQDAMTFDPVPVSELPNLESITFYERTGGAAPTSFTFSVAGPELTVRLADPLAIGNFDISGASGEFYDVYYSDENGEFQLDGSYLTISGTFSQALPAGGGLNLAEISLNFNDASPEYGNYVASFVALGDNAYPDTVPNAIDGDLQTHTTMGNTVGQTERLRLTLGFESTSGPPG